MRAEEIRPVDLTTGAGYDSQWALMRDLFVWLDLRLYYFYAHHQWLGPSSEMKNMLGLVVTRGFLCARTKCGVQKRSCVPLARGRGVKWEISLCAMTPLFPSIEMRGMQRI